MKTISTVYRAIYVALVAAALVMDLGLPKGRVDWYILNYYTILSNIACFVFFAVLLARQARKTPASPGMSPGTPLQTAPRAEAAIVFTITITGLIYAFILGPSDFTMATDRFFSFPNMMLHYVGPTMVILDWLLFCPKGRIRALDPLRWLLIPLLYFAYILVRSTFAGKIGAAASATTRITTGAANPATDTGSAFPYGFIDPAVQGGWDKMLTGVAIIALGMAALGYLIYMLDRLLARRGNRRA